MEDKASALLLKLRICLLILKLVKQEWLRQSYVTKIAFQTLKLRIWDNVGQHLRWQVVGALGELSALIQYSSKHTILERNVCNLDSILHIKCTLTECGSKEISLSPEDILVYNEHTHCVWLWLP